MAWRLWTDNLQNNDIFLNTNNVVRQRIHQFDVDSSLKITITLSRRTHQKPQWQRRFDRPRVLYGSFSFWCVDAKRGAVVRRYFSVVLPPIYPFSHNYSPAIMNIWTAVNFSNLFNPRSFRPGRNTRTHFWYRPITTIVVCAVPQNKQTAVISTEQCGGFWPGKRRVGERGQEINKLKQTAGPTT